MIYFMGWRRSWIKCEIIWYFLLMSKFYNISNKIEFCFVYLFAFFSFCSSCIRLLCTGRVALGGMHWWAHMEYEVVTKFCRKDRSPLYNWQKELELQRICRKSEWKRKREGGRGQTKWWIVAWDMTLFGTLQIFIKSTENYVILIHYILVESGELSAFKNKITVTGEIQDGRLDKLCACSIPWTH